MQKCDASTSPNPSLQRRGKDAMPFTPLDPSLCSGQAKEGKEPHEMRPLQMPNTFAKTKTLDSRFRSPITNVGDRCRE